MGSIDSSLNISLPPPGQGGNDEQYSQLAVNLRTNKPVGQDPDDPGPDSSKAFNANLTAVFGDDIDSLEEAQDITNKLNINLQLGGSIKKAEAAMQEELDTLDPSNPRVPILGKYIDICDKLLEGKSIPGVTFAVGEDIDGTYLQIDADGVGAPAAAAAPTTHLSGKVGGNPWLAGNAYVTFLINFITLAKLMMQNKAVESKAELASITMMFELGNLAASQIRKAGENAAEMHRVAAITAAITAGVTALTTTISAAKMYQNKIKAEPIGEESFTKVPQGKVPNLNNEARPVLGPDGQPKMVDVPRYIRVNQPPEINQGHPIIYRNEPKPFFNRSGVDSLGKPYLPRGQKPFQLTENAGKTFGISGVNPEGIKVNGKVITDQNYLDGEPFTKKTPEYAQHEIELRPNGEKGVKISKQSIQEDKLRIKAENEIRSQKYTEANMFAQFSREFSSQTGKSVEEFLKIQLEISKSEADALKEIFSTISRIISHAMDRATEGFKAQSELITQLMQQLDAIRAKLQEAVSAAMRKGG